jgi:hypothetical protein
MRAHGTRTLAGALACLCLFALAAAPAATQATQMRRKQSQKKYKIYCVAKVIEIESKSLNELQENSKSGPVCELSQEEFTSLYKAREAAKEFGGAGEPCECHSKTAQ